MLFGQEHLGYCKLKRPADPRRRADISPIRFSPSSLKEGRWYEYLVRFALGGAATVFTGLISSRYGAPVGGLFLALPAIFCASATLVEKHKIRRKQEAGLDGRQRERRLPRSTPPVVRSARWACWPFRSCFR
jgi:Protein of unknown function (DUF3147)